ILPNVIKEAMAVGVPVVTTRLEGIEELVQDGISGLLVAPGDTNALAAEIEMLLLDARLRERLTARGRPGVQEFFDRPAKRSGLGWRQALARAALPHRHGSVQRQRKQLEESKTFTMRVAYVSADHGVPVFGQKGCSIHAQEVLRALLRQGAKVELFSTRCEG